MKMERVLLFPFQPSKISGGGKKYGTQSNLNHSGSASPVAGAG